MGKKKTRGYRAPENLHDDRVMRVLQNLTHSDLQRECVLRGMSFEDVIKLGHHALVSWFYKHFDNTQDENLLTQYDVWLEGELINRGHKRGDAMLSPSLRLGYVKGVENLEKPISMKPNSTPKLGAKKAPAPVNEVTGVRAGTKKNLTMELTMQGKPIDEIIKTVKDAFPGAEEKSIKIWHKRKLKEVKNAS